MSNATKATLHIPIPVKNETGSNEVASGEYLYIPKNPKAWLSELLKYAEGNEELFLTVSNQTDCPDTFYITFSSSPTDEAINGLDKGTHFGIYTNHEVVRSLHDALGFLLGEVEREHKKP